MKLVDKVSNAVKNGQLYNLDHFHMAWENPSKRRLMGNEMVYPPSPKVIAAIESIAHSVNYYAEDPGTNVNLLSALSDYVGVQGGAEWVAVGNGSTELIEMIPKAFINPGDEVLLPSPEYSPYSRRPLLFGATIIDVIPDENFVYKTEDFVNKITSNTKLIIMSRPNAPIGNLIKEDVIEDLCHTDCIIVVDEAYAEFSEQSLSSLVKKYDNLIVMRTFSKGMGLAGIRLGFIVANPEIISYINRVRVNANVGLIPQTVALAALDDIEYIKKNIKLVIESREWFQKELSQAPGIKVFPSKGNFVLMDVKKTGKTAEDYIQALWQKGYIGRNLSGGRNMDGLGYLRISIGTQDDMEQVAKIIKEL